MIYHRLSVVVALDEKHLCTHFVDTLPIWHEKDHETIQ